MERDFTYGIYENLIKAAKGTGYDFLTVKDYISNTELPERFLIMRHDVDRKPENALDMARIESELGVSTTYYFRIIDKTFKPDIISKVADLGHEVGYHYEDMDTAEGNIDEARELFSANLNRFREYTNVETVSMHGNPLTPYDNRNLWNNAEFDDYDLLGEVYLSIDFTDVVYFSDTNRTWLSEKTIVNDWPIGPSKQPEEVDSTSDLIDLLVEQRHSRIYLLVHPNRWADSYSEWVAEHIKDRIINIGKYGLYIIRSIRGKNIQSEVAK